VIDLENTRAALLLAGGAGDLAAAECFLPGGRRLSRAAFLAAAASEGPGRAAALLAAAFDRTRFAPILGRHGADPAALERALLAAAIREQTEAARSFPIGPAPLLGYLLRLRAEVIDLRRIVWGRALGAPPGALIASLVSAS
jgi:vacuolar-type H+-ATPase subunit C/Vma6